MKCKIQQYHNIFQYTKTQYIIWHWSMLFHPYFISISQLTRQLATFYFTHLQGTKSQHLVISIIMWYQNMLTSGESLEHCYTLIKQNWILSSVTFAMTQKSAVGICCLDGYRKLLVLRGISYLQPSIIFHSHLFMKLHVKVHVKV